MKNFIAVFCLMITCSTVIAEPNLLTQFNQRAELNYKQSVNKVISFVTRSANVAKVNFEGQAIILPKNSEFLALLTTKTNDLCGIKDEANVTPGFRAFSVVCYDSEGRETFREYTRDAKKSAFQF